MKYLKKTFPTALAVILVLLLFGLPAFAAADAPYEAPTRANGILSVSHRGNTADYPENSLEAIKSAEEIGADMISVSVGKTADGVLVLCNTDVPLSQVCPTDKAAVGELTFSELSALRLYDSNASISECRTASLEEAVDALTRSVLVLDNAWDFRDEIYAAVKSTGRENRVILRTDVSSKEIAAWTAENPGLFVIGVYKANIVWNAVSHFNRLEENGQPLVQYQSKNYFNVSFGSFVADRFAASEKTRAVAAMYSPDLCGQREDSCVGWDEMIRRGFSVIETNAIASLVNYIRSIEEAENSLTSLYRKAESADLTAFSSVSAKNLRASLSEAEAVLNDGKGSLGEMENAFSSLNESMKNLAFQASGDVQKGGLNITAGKIIAAVVVAAAILAGEIYVFKMHKPGRKKEKGSKH